MMIGIAFYGICQRAGKNAKYKMRDDNLGIRSKIL